MSYSTVVLLLAFVLGQGFWGPKAGAVELELRPAIRVGVQSACVLAAPVSQTSIAMPAGNKVEVRFSTDILTRLPVTSATRLLVKDITASNPAGPLFEVVLFPENSEANRIKLALRQRPECYWLLAIGGRIVQLDVPGYRGDGGISGGLFSSLEAALAAYHRTREDVEVEVESAAEAAREKAFWAWRKEMDLWEVACDPKWQRRFQESQPENFEVLKETFNQVDCSVKPKPPTDAASEEADHF